MKELFHFRLENDDCDLERIDRLRKKMQKRTASICAERALIYTKSFRETEGEPYIIRKSKAIAKTLHEKKIYN